MDILIKFKKNLLI